MKRLILLFSLFLLLAACASPAPAPTVTPASTPTPPITKTPTAVPSLTATNTEAPTITPENTMTPKPLEIPPVTFPDFANFSWETSFTPTTQEGFNAINQKILTDTSSQVLTVNDSVTPIDVFDKGFDPNGASIHLYLTFYGPVEIAFPDTY